MQKNKENKMNKAFFTTLYLLPATAIAHPGSGMVHDLQHLLWLAVGAAALVTAVTLFIIKAR